MDIGRHFRCTLCDEGGIRTMGWVWRDDVEDTNSISGDVSKYQGPPDRCSTRRIVKSHCRTEEVEPGKFIRKCERQKRSSVIALESNFAGSLSSYACCPLFRRVCCNIKLDSGRMSWPVEVVQSNKEYTEDDVTEEVCKVSSSAGFLDNAIFDLSGLQSDVDASGQSFLGTIDGFFHAAEEMKKGFFDIFDDDPHAEREFPSSSRRSGIPMEVHRQKESSLDPGNTSLQ